MGETVFCFPFSERVLIVSEDLSPAIKAEIPKCLYDSAIISTIEPFIKTNLSINRIFQ